ncbi:MAG: Fe-S cluster assembly protein SufD [Cytophagales bacterium]|nr:Fe-S cluster assembly protein SufD [Cytophagales bacterium]
MVTLNHSAEALRPLFESQDGKFEKIRNAGWASFEKTGWPTRRDEEYKFTALDAIFKRNVDFSDGGFTYSIDKDYAHSKFYSEDGHHLVFVNGNYIESWSSIGEGKLSLSAFDKLNSENLATIVNQFGDDRASVAINHAFLSNGISIKVGKSVDSLPVFIYHFRDASESTTLSFPYIHVQAEENAQICLYEKSFSSGTHLHFASHMTGIEVGRNANVQFTKIQGLEKRDYTLDNLFVKQHESSHFFANTFSLSGSLIRNNTDISLDGQHCEANMYGLYFLDGHSHVDNHTVVDHRFPNCDSNELYKGIVDEHAAAVFNGKIFVRQAAQKTNAFQSNNNVSLSDTATIHTKPQLEIWADDVKCSHGCTIGQLDSEALFYLESRGIKPDMAKAMLLGAFAQESLDHVNLDIIKDEVSAHIHNRLGV